MLYWNPEPLLIGSCDSKTLDLGHVLLYWNPGPLAINQTQDLGHVLLLLRFRSQ